MLVTMQNKFVRLMLLLAGCLLVAAMPVQAFADASEDASTGTEGEHPVSLQEDEPDTGDERDEPAIGDEIPDEPEPAAPAEFTSGGIYCKDTLLGALAFNAESHPALLDEDGEDVAKIAPERYEANSKSYIFVKAIVRNVSQAGVEDTGESDGDGSASDITITKLRYHEGEWQAYSDHWFAVEPDDVVFCYCALVSVTVEFVDESGVVVDTAIVSDIKSGSDYDVSDTVASVPDGYVLAGEPDIPVSGIADDDILIKVPVTKESSEPDDPDEPGTETPEKPPIPGIGGGDDNPATKPELPTLPGGIPPWMSGGSFGDISSLFPNFDISSMFSSMFSGMFSNMFSGMFSFGSGNGNLSWGAPSFSMDFPTSYTNDDEPDDAVELDAVSTGNKAASTTTTTEKHTPTASKDAEEVRFDFAAWATLAGIVIVIGVVSFALMRKKKKNQ